MNPRYPIIASRANHRCEYCRAPEALFNSPFEVEHIIPPFRGGLEDETNLALACRSCNVFKGSHISAFDEQTNTEERLFNPRTDLWEHHFLFDPESGQIEGRTSIGRVTVARLAINESVQVLARRLWAELRVFP